MEKQTNDTARPGLQRDPDEWKTGDEPMTEEFDESLSKAAASKRIDELRERSPRLSQE
jgi:hypothetical protein